MTLVNYIVGADAALLERDEVLLETTRRSQEIRTRESVLSAGIVLFIGLIAAGSLWNRTDNTLLIIWGLAIAILAVWRHSIARKVRSTLLTASPQKLMQNEAEYEFSQHAPLYIKAGGSEEKACLLYTSDAADE